MKDGKKRTGTSTERVIPELGVSRKRFLSLLGLSAAGLTVGSCGRSDQRPSGTTANSLSTEAESVEERVSRIIAAYDAQGIHRTGTDGDQACARWLAEEVDGLG